MKVVNRLSFGVSAVKANQKSAVANVTPSLCVSCTGGKFTVTPPVSRAMNVAVGENIMFLNNIAAVEDAVHNKVEDIVAYANENGINLDTFEGEQKVISEFTQWYIAKGVAKFKPNGDPIMVNERSAKGSKEKYLQEHAMDIVNENRTALIEKFGNVSDEELASKLTIDMIPNPKTQAFEGSRTATVGTGYGVGCTLNFTDTSTWNALKDNLEESEKTSCNRYFDVKLDQSANIEFNNGYQNVTITIYPIDFKEDVKVTPRKSSNND